MSPRVQTLAPSRASHDRNSPSGACAIMPSWPEQLLPSNLTPSRDVVRNQRGAKRRGDPQNSTRPYDVTPNTK
jgi:hypothetical protein